MSRKNFGPKSNKKIARRRTEKSSSLHSEDVIYATTSELAALDGGFSPHDFFPYGRFYISGQITNGSQNIFEALKLMGRNRTHELVRRVDNAELEALRQPSLYNYPRAAAGKKDNLALAYWNRSNPGKEVRPYEPFKRKVTFIDIRSK